MCVRCRTVSELALHSDHPNASSAKQGFGWAEVYFHLHGLELPPRPEFYPSTVTRGELPPAPMSAAARAQRQPSGTRHGCVIA